ncbi:putative ATP synthase protein I [Megalodesulfovibrio gigas DSM 1382 = ATCC 19364]|uniref:Putative ATP synthase protein I n=2 Tax=Megalodesulfovibrio gigas TaxID=879 RepID=T2GB33_MEGG1|nr:putative ATP synthase protein I [Megalodesulfovibrio gigas DSM 1382 = ATCC 19364]
MAEHDSRSQGTGAAPSKKEGGPLQVLAGVSSNAGLLGLHMVSSTAVGLAMGWFLDKWLGTKPWLMIVFLGMGIVEGFRNMWREAQRMRKQDDAVRAAQDAGEAPPETDSGRLVFFKKEHFAKTYVSPVRPDGPDGLGGPDASDSPARPESADVSLPGEPKNASPAGEKSDEVLDEEALRQALIRELQEAKADPETAEALRMLLKQQAGSEASEMVSQICGAECGQDASETREALPGNHAPHKARSNES